MSSGTLLVGWKEIMGAFGGGRLKLGKRNILVPRYRYAQMDGMELWSDQAKTGGFPLSSIAPVRFIRRIL